MKQRDTQANLNAARPKDAKPGTDPQVQGEGDYAADRRYRERTDHFLERTDLEQVARAAAPRSEEEAQQMRDAEEEGRAHAHLPPKPSAGAVDRPTDPGNKPDR